jgi:hypothetical protein
MTTPPKRTDFKPDGWLHTLITTIRVAADLVVLARYVLKPGGRLVFFLPAGMDE